MKSIPIAADISIAYNVARGGVLPGSALDGQSLDYRWRGAEPEPLALDEAERVDRFFNRTIRKYLKAMRFPKLTDLRSRVWGISSIGDPCGDRTLSVVFTYLPMVDEEFVAHIQEKLRNNWREWRLLHCEAQERLDLNLAIYPEGISVGDTVSTDRYEDCIAKWRESVFAYHDPRDGPLRRQLRECERLLLTRTLEEWRSSAPVVLQAFDNCEGDGSVQSIWLVTGGDHPFEAEVAADDEIQEGNWYAIGRNRTIGQLTPLKGSNTGLWLSQILLPRRESHSLSIGSQLLGAIDRFVSDKDLARREHKA